ANDLLALGRTQIDRDRLLAAIEGEVVGAFAPAVAFDERLEAARLVTAIGLLNLDHGGTELGEDHARERAGQHPREVENGDMAERFHRLSRFLANARMRLLTSRPAASASSSGRSSTR